MPTNTRNYNLVKPTQEEFYNVDVPNNNMDIIDRLLKEFEDAINSGATEQELTLLKEALTRHVADKTNPHSVTKTQVGLSAVENYGVATVTEAKAGSVNNKYMTPLRIKEAISSLAEKNVANGYAGLGPDGKLPDSLFPTNTSKALYGQYVGDGVAGRLIPLGFSPKMMFIIRRDTYYGIISYAFVNDLGYVMNYVGGQTSQYSGKTQRIEGQNLIAGMNNSNSLNAGGTVYEYMAFV